MKRHLIIALTLAVIPWMASAQSKAVEDLAKKYSDRDGFTTTVIKGDLISGMGEGMKVQQIDISNLMNDITSIIIISADKPDKQFSEDVSKAVAAGNYSTIMSVSDKGQQIKFLLSTVSEGEGKKKESRNEFLMVILGGEDNMLVSIMGKYKLKKISKSEDETDTKKQEENE